MIESRVHTHSTWARTKAKLGLRQVWLKVTYKLYLAYALRFSYLISLPRISLIHSFSSTHTLTNSTCSRRPFDSTKLYFHMTLSYSCIHPTRSIIFHLFHQNLIFIPALLTILNLRLCSCLSYLPYLITSSCTALTRLPIRLFGLFFPLDSNVHSTQPNLILMQTYLAQTQPTFSFLLNSIYIEPINQSLLFSFIPSIAPSLFDDIIPYPTHLFIPQPTLSPLPSIIHSLFNYIIPYSIYIFIELDPHFHLFGSTHSSIWSFELWSIIPSSFANINFCFSISQLYLWSTFLFNL